MKTLSEQPLPMNYSLVVKLVTSYYNNDRGIHMKKSLLYLKKKSIGSYNRLREDCLMAGTETVFPRIINLNECKDGIYEVMCCNFICDGDSIEDWDYKLVPYIEKEK